MSILSIFTSHEKLFAAWMMHYKFNQEIKAEPCFPEENQDEVQESYYTVAESSPTPVKLSEEEKEAIRKVWLRRMGMHLVGSEKEEERKKKLGLSEHSVTLDFANVTRTNGGPRQDKYVPKQKPTYQIVHGPAIQTVEKKAFLESVKYGNFWGRTCFTATEKQTGYFLLNGWLVVSVPKIIKVKPFEFYDGNETITVVHQYDENLVGEDLDPVARKIAGHIKEWFNWQTEKLLIVAKASLAGATLFSVILSALGKPDHLAGELFGLALAISGIATYAMAFYSSVKLYQLHCFKDKMNSIQNLGDWVQHVRRSVINYPDLFERALNIYKFFTSGEQVLIMRSAKSAGTSVAGYARRFFQKIPILGNFIPVKV
jgi:hypothetical protein